MSVTFTLKLTRLEMEGLKAFITADEKGCLSVNVEKMLDGIATKIDASLFSGTDGGE